MEEIVFPECQKCSTGVLVPLSDYGRDGATIMYKAWVCTNPECGRSEEHTSELQSH